jgi:HSP20 family protein
MTLLKFSSDPFDNILRLQRALTRSLGDPFHGAAWTPSGRGVFPSLNIFEADGGDAVVVKAEVPGMEPEELRIETFRDRLTIAGERSIAPPDEAFRYHRRERRAGEFRRVFRLPFEVDRDSAKATYEDGILTVRLEKAEEARPRSIQVGA